MKRLVLIGIMILLCYGCAAPFIAATAYSVYEASRAKSGQEAPHE